MSEIILTVRLELKLLGLKDFFESERRAKEVVLEALSTSDRIKKVLLLNVESVKQDGETPKMEVRNG